MAKVKHLHEIKGRFAVRVGVPASLRGIVFGGGPGSELREWLGTDRKAAERAAPEIVTRFFARSMKPRLTLLLPHPRWAPPQSTIVPLNWLPTIGSAVAAAL